MIYDIWYMIYDTMIYIYICITLYFGITVNLSCLSLTLSFWNGSVFLRWSEFDGLTSRRWRWIDCPTSPPPTARWPACPCAPWVGCWYTAVLVKNNGTIWNHGRMRFASNERWGKQCGFSPHRVLRQIFCLVITINIKSFSPAALGGRMPHRPSTMCIWDGCTELGTFDHIAWECPRRSCNIPKPAKFYLLSMVGSLQIKIVILMLCMVGWFMCKRLFGPLSIHDLRLFVSWS